MSTKPTRNDLTQTLEELIYSLKSDPESWENDTLERYLEAMQAWLKDSAKGNDEPPSWELIIKMLKAGRLYE